MSQTLTLLPIGQWLGDSFRAVRQRWWTLTALAVSGTLAGLLGAAAVYALAAACAYLFTDKALLARFATPEGMQALAADPRMGTIVFLMNMLALAVGIRLACEFLLASIHVVCDHSLGYRSSLRLAKERSRDFTVLFLVTHTAVQLGWALFLIPGLVLSVFLGFAPFAFVREDTGVWASIGSSWRTASGRFWPILGRMVALGLVCLAIGIVPVVGWILAPCLAYCAWAGLYRQLKTREVISAEAGPRARPAPPRPEAAEDPVVTIGRGGPRRPRPRPDQPEHPA